MRVIRLDSSLLYLVTGALSYVADREPLEETGTLTREEARGALSAMVWAYLTETVEMAIVGEIRAMMTETIPDRWLACDGTVLYDAEDYPALYAEIGRTFTVPSDPEGTFRVMDTTDLSLMGVGSVLQAIGGTAGEIEHTLITDEMPQHDHVLNDPGHNHPPISPAISIFGQRTGGSSTVSAGSNFGGMATTGNRVTGITMDMTGGGLPHNNLHPVIGVRFIVYAGQL